MVFSSFTATEYCAFCHEQFPPDRVPGPDAWQSLVRAVLCLNPKDGGSIEMTQPLYLPSHYKDVDVNLSYPPQTSTITISRQPPERQKSRTNRIAFCFHSWCYSVLIWEMKGCSVSVIYRLARALVPDSSIWEQFQERRHNLNSASRLRILALSREQPLFISRLPLELRTYIWRFVGLMTPYSAFILVKTETSRLVSHIRSPLSHEIILQQGSCISANMLSIFGTEYIQDLMIDKDSKDSRRSIRDTTGVKYITSLAGLCAIQLLGVDWESDWIGKIPSTGSIWHGVIRGSVSTLRFSDSGLNYTTISLAEKCSKTTVVWDQTGFPSTLLDPEATLFDLNRDIIRSVPTGTERLFLRYLSFYLNDEYIRGISVYMSGMGIVGLEAHFTRVSRLSGSRSGCPLHFSLSPDERIAYAWLHFVNVPRFAFAAPSLVIQTTLGRLHTFGPYIFPYILVDNGYKWLLLQHKGYIAGLYYENVKSGIIMRLGVTGDGITTQAAPLSPQYYNCGFPSPPIGTPNVGLFLSIAVLQGLERVDMCRVGKRCTGLMIHYLGRHTSVLGQWHTSGVSQISCIYNSNAPAVTNIYFELSRFGDRQIVTAISFTPFAAGGTSDSYHRVCSVGEHIVWWFSERYDEISHWMGELESIPEESMMNLIV